MEVRSRLCGSLLVVGLATLSLGCQTMPRDGAYPNPHGIVRSAIVGSMTGAAIGAGIDHRNRGRGALVGALGGLLAGALFGDRHELGGYRDHHAHAPHRDGVWCDEHHTWEDADDWDDWEDWEEPATPQRDPDPPDTTIGLAPPDVLFDPGSAELTPGAKSHLRRVADRVRADDDLELLLRGHTDASGEESFALSELRARNVRAFLTEEGVARRRIAWVGFGDAQPVASIRTAAGRQRNRRVEVVLRERDPALS
jgi:outer membrane protein OmpA-like peptidoglycan-associated protein